MRNFIVVIGLYVVGWLIGVWVDSFVIKYVMGVITIAVMPLYTLWVIVGYYSKKK